jgi:uncharacterized protein YjbI with pentapeptide repeats
VVAGAGLVLIVTANPGSVWTNVGQALLSGAVLGGVFLAIERVLAAEAEDRSREAGLRLQLTTTEALVGIDLRRQNLRGMYLPGRQLTAANLAGADLASAVLLHADLRHATLVDAELGRADLGGSALCFADLSHCRAASTNFVDCDSSDADFSFASLVGADFTASSLRRANLSYADLSHANLNRCDLTGADLRTATLAEVSLSGITYDDSTRWPDKFGPVPESSQRRDDWPRHLSLGEWLIRRRSLVHPTPPSEPT